MMDIVLRKSICKFEMHGKFILKVDRPEYEKNPKKVRSVPDNAFWRAELSWPDHRRRYDLAPAKKTTKKTKEVKDPDPKPNENSKQEENKEK